MHFGRAKEGRLGAGRRKSTPPPGVETRAAGKGKVWQQSTTQGTGGRCTGWVPGRGLQGR